MAHLFTLWLMASLNIAKEWGGVGENSNTLFFANIN
jgi:hypothetical protein